LSTQARLRSVICVFSQNYGLAAKDAGIELISLVNFLASKLAMHAHNANREMNPCNLIGGYFLGELS